MIKEGILNFNKTRGMSSNDAVYLLRKLSGTKKIGHLGTLDPLAEGVLPLAVGRASKIMEYLEIEYKKYSCTMLLGLESDSLDTDGRILRDERESLIFPDRERIEACLKAFEGSIEQYPPLYSAVRIRGKHLYEYAREGKQVEIKPRRVYVRSLRLLEISAEEKSISFEVGCSKGTYIRSLCRDIGEALGSFGCMKSLVRLESGPFSIEDAVSAERLSEISLLKGELREEAINKLLTAPDRALRHFGEAETDAERSRLFCNGGKIALRNARLVSGAKKDGSLNELCGASELSKGSGLIYIKNNFVNYYKMYGLLPEGRTFLGVAKFDEKHGIFTADKIFYKGFLK